MFYTTFTASYKNTNDFPMYIDTCENHTDLFLTSDHHK